MTCDMNNIRTIFIAGLHRSGTTILNMILGSHSRCVAVGEVDNVIKPGQDRSWVEDHYHRCTCGSCTFWPDVMEAIDESGAEDLKARYTVFLKIFSEHFPGKIPVDSSKHLSTFKDLSSVSSCIPVRIVRDVRGWSVSLSNQITPRNMLRWYRMNRKHDTYLRGAISLGYEPLALHTEETLISLCKSLSLEYEQTMLEINNSDNHILVGNRMRTEQSLKIDYDSRWMAKTSIWPALLKPIMRYNSRLVYNQINP